MNWRSLAAYRRRLPFLGALALVPLAIGWFLDARAFHAAWLIAWWTCASFVLGAQANLWLYGLTGGSWRSPVHGPSRMAALGIPALSLLALPLFLNLHALYPWMEPGWAEDLAMPQFKRLWLSPEFFLARLFAYLLIWNGLSWFRPRGSGPGVKVYRALGLLVWAFTITLAAIDLIMSLTPHWYSTGFGLVVITAQMKAGFALAVLAGALAAQPGQRRDLGNLLLMYVLMWAYLAFVQLQIIWAENLPHEIVWYEPRLLGSYRILGIVLVSAGFVVPLFLLLIRAFKENGTCLRALAALLCLVAYLESVWLIAPSIPGMSGNLLWMSPLALFAMVLLIAAWVALWNPQGVPGRFHRRGGHGRTVRT